MTGSMRLYRLVLASGRLSAIAVFTGELFDADGSKVGVGSRRSLVPVEIVHSGSGTSVSILALEVDLLGLTVSIEPFTVELGAGRPEESREFGRGLEGIPS
jgi:hypothetical protein